MAEICVCVGGGVQFGPGKELLAIKVSYQTFLLYLGCPINMKSCIAKMFYF